MTIFNRGKMVVLATGVALAFPGTAAAQSLLDLQGDQLRGELQTRYDAALAATLDPAVYAANDPRFIWASEAKVQCGIAIGFMKSSTRDEPSIRKCETAYARMQVQAAPAVVQPMAPPPPQLADYCTQQLAGMVFFDWDSALLPDSAAPTVEEVAQRFTTCGWSGLTIVGHTDRSGSDSYNEGLSMRRAQAVVSYLTSRGIAASALSVSAKGEREPRVPTPDGERNPQNRRVEIGVN